MNEGIPENMTGKTEKKSIRPGFLGGNGGGDTPVGLNTENPGLGREDASVRAAESLGAAEKSATGGGYTRIKTT